MARYASEYQGIPGWGGEPRGMDPNHRGGYQGMRMQSGPHQAPYGWHRWTHPNDFEASGGFRGRYGGAARETGERYLNSRPSYDRDLRGGGGVHDWRYDTEYLRDFNAESTRFGPDGRWGVRSGAAPEESGLRQRRPYDGGFRWGRPPRGMSEGGYSEPWTWGPMRGSR
jgi:hypothetical protein